MRSLRLSKESLDAAAFGGYAFSSMNRSSDSISPRSALVVCLSRAWSGLEAAALASAEALLRRGVACSVAAPPGSPLELEARGRGLDCVPIETRGWLVSASASWALRQWLNERRGCAVFCPRLRDLFVVRPALIGLGKIRLAAAAIFAAAIERRRSALGRWIFGRVDALVAHSNAQKAELMRRVPVPAARVPVLSPAIDLARFNPERRSSEMRKAWSLKEGELAIGAIARAGNRISRRQAAAKNGEAPDGGMIQALAIVLRNKSRLKWKLILVADPSEPDAALAAVSLAQDAASRLGSARVLLLDSHVSLPEFLATVDLFVSTEISGAFDARLLEAMASGVPTFAPAAGVVPELVKDSRASLLWRLGNPWDLSRLLERAIMDPHVRTRVGAEGQKLARSRHDALTFESELVRFVLGSTWTAPATAAPPEGDASEVAPFKCPDPAALPGAPQAPSREPEASL